MRQLQQQRVIAAAGLGALLVAVLVAVLTGVRTDGEGEAGAAPATTAEQPATAKPPAAPAQPKRVAVPLRGLRGFDPEGDGREGDDTAALATDGKPATAWETENYRSFFKDGVGLLLDAGRPVTLTRVVVQTGSPGIAVGIRVGTSAEGPFSPVTNVKKLTPTTTFTPRALAGRYVVVWVDDIPGGGRGSVAEVRAWRAG